MAALDPTKRLKKELTLLTVFALSLSATLSSGFFLLPGLAATEAGPAVIIVYLIAAIPLLPGMLSAIELSTAMPRAGGVYYFLDRSLGPMFGTIGGFGTWLALVLKTSFALVGLGAYLGLFFGNVPVEELAVGLAILFGIVNYLGAKKAGRTQVFLLMGLIILLIWFVVTGVPKMTASHFSGFFDKGSASIFSAAGLVCVSYIGLTNVASVSEEVKNPDRVLPLSIFLALGASLVVYGVGTAVMVGVLPMDQLAGSYTAVADVADQVMGHTGKVIMTVAAVLAFISVANAGILSSSRYPLAMSRDHLLPSAFRRLSRFGTPTYAIVLTVALIIITVVFLDPMKIAKLAGAFQLVMFALSCVAVIVMRESQIESYDPGYKMPFYPWLPMVGIVAPFGLIVFMGWLPVLFTLGMTAFGVIWYYTYARDRVIRGGAIYHVFERLGRMRFEGLDPELRTILKEKGLREQDPFDEVVARAFVIEAKGGMDFEAVVEEVSGLLAERLPCSADKLARGFLEGTRVGATPVSGGAALPHVRLSGIEAPELVIVRAKAGVEISTGDVFGSTRTSDPNQALFFLVSSEDDPGQHLRILAQLAERIDQSNFITDWMQASDEQAMKELLLRDEYHLSVVINRDAATRDWCDRELREIVIPEGCLVVLIRRGDESIIPRGSTSLMQGDRVTVIGHVNGIRELRQKLDESTESG